MYKKVLPRLLSAGTSGRYGAYSVPGMRMQAERGPGSVLMTPGIITNG